MLIQNNKAPLLYLIFNRPQKVKETFRAISIWQPSELYISCDGPRNAEDQTLIDECLYIIQSNIKWDCELKINKFPKNLGCKNGVMNGINWFFSQVSSGVICEDDVVLSTDFFDFSSVILAKYENNMSIFGVSACGEGTKNYRNDTDYYCTNFPTVWGWATWKDRWAKINPNMTEWPIEGRDIVKKISSHKSSQLIWQSNF